MRSVEPGGDSCREDALARPRQGEAGATVQGASDDCEVLAGSGMTIVHVELPDQSDLMRLLDRITDLRLELVQMHCVSPVTPTPTDQGRRPPRVSN